MPDAPFPPVPAELVQALDAQFPLRPPEMDWPDRRIWLEAGQRKLIDFLKTQLQRQSKSVPNVFRKPT
jgi:hypothetical protein